MHMGSYAHGCACIWGLYVCLHVVYVSGFEKTTHFARFIDFELVTLCESRVVGLSITLCCASIAASVPEIHLPKM